MPDIEERPTIEDYKQGVGTIILGYPIWRGDMPMAVTSFFRELRLEWKNSNSILCSCRKCFARDRSKHSANLYRC